VLLRAERLHPGQFVQATVTGSRDYDLIAELPRNRSRSLSVIPAL
jgi:hypothetical protein